MNANAFEYYSINAHSDFVNCYNRLQERIISAKYSINHNCNHKQQATIQKISPMSEYISQLTSSSITHIELQSVEDLLAVETSTQIYIEEQLKSFTTSKRCRILSSVANNFHRFCFDYSCYDGPKSQEKKAVCTTLKKFKHSCKPSIEIRNDNDEHKGWYRVVCMSWFCKLPRT